jgi:hypothetical protein
MNLPHRPPLPPLPVPPRDPRAPPMRYFPPDDQRRQPIDSRAWAEAAVRSAVRRACLMAASEMTLMATQM